MRALFLLWWFCAASCSGLRGDRFAGSPPVPVVVIQVDGLTSQLLDTYLESGLSESPGSSLKQLATKRRTLIAPAPASPRVFAMSLLTGAPPRVHGVRSDAEPAPAVSLQHSFGPAIESVYAGRLDNVAASVVATEREDAGRSNFVTSYLDKEKRRQRVVFIELDELVSPARKSDAVIALSSIDHRIARIRASALANDPRAVILVVGTGPSDRLDSVSHLAFDDVNRKMVVSSGLAIIPGGGRDVARAFAINDKIESVWLRTPVGLRVFDDALGELRAPTTFEVRHPDLVRRLDDALNIDDVALIPRDSVQLRATRDSVVLGGVSAAESIVPVLVEASGATIAAPGLTVGDLHAVIAEVAGDRPSGHGVTASLVADLRRSADACRACVRGAPNGALTADIVAATRPFIQDAASMECRGSGEILIASARRDLAEEAAAVIADRETEWRTPADDKLATMSCRLDIPPGISPSAGHDLAWRIGRASRARIVLWSDARAGAFYLTVLTPELRHVLGPPWIGSMLPGTRLPVRADVLASGPTILNAIGHYVRFVHGLRQLYRGNMAVALTNFARSDELDPIATAWKTVWSTLAAQHVLPEPAHETYLKALHDLTTNAGDEEVRWPGVIGSMLSADDEARTAVPPNTAPSAWREDRAMLLSTLTAQHQRMGISPDECSTDEQRATAATLIQLEHELARLGAASFEAEAKLAIAENQSDPGKRAKTLAEAIAMLRSPDAGWFRSRTVIRAMHRFKNEQSQRGFLDDASALATAGLYRELTADRESRAPGFQQRARRLFSLLERSGATDRDGWLRRSVEQVLQSGPEGAATLVGIFYELNLGGSNMLFGLFYRTLLNGLLGLAFPDEALSAVIVAAFEADPSLGQSAAMVDALAKLQAAFSRIGAQDLRGALDVLQSAMQSTPDSATLDARATALAAGQDETTTTTAWWPYLRLITRATRAYLLVRTQQPREAQIEIERATELARLLLRSTAAPAQVATVDALALSTSRSLRAVVEPDRAARSALLRESAAALASLNPERRFAMADGLPYWLLLGETAVRDLNVLLELRRDVRSQNASLALTALTAFVNGMAEDFRWSEVFRFYLAMQIAFTDTARKGALPTWDDLVKHSLPVVRRIGAILRARYPKEILHAGILDGRIPNALLELLIACVSGPGRELDFLEASRRAAEILPWATQSPLLHAFLGIVALESVREQPGRALDILATVRRDLAEAQHREFTTFIDILEIHALISGNRLPEALRTADTAIARCAGHAAFLEPIRAYLETELGHNKRAALAFDEYTRQVLDKNGTPETQLKLVVNDTGRTYYIEFKLNINKLLYGNLSRTYNFGMGWSDTSEATLTVNYSWVLSTKLQTLAMLAALRSWLAFQAGDDRTAMRWIGELIGLSEGLRTSETGDLITGDVGPLFDDGGVLLWLGTTALAHGHVGVAKILFDLGQVSSQHPSACLERDPGARSSCKPPEMLSDADDPGMVALVHAAADWRATGRMSGLVAALQRAEHARSRLVTHDAAAALQAWLLGRPELVNTATSPAAVFARRVLNHTSEPIPAAFGCDGLWYAALSGVDDITLQRGWADCGMSFETIHAAFRSAGAEPDLASARHDLVFAVTNAAAKFEHFTNDIDTMVGGFIGRSLDQPALLDALGELIPAARRMPPLENNLRVIRLALELAAGKSPSDDAEHLLYRAQQQGWRSLFRVFVQRVSAERTAKAQVARNFLTELRPQLPAAP